jgi:hypothetical protein
MAPWLRWLVALCDWTYRSLRGLDRPEAQVGPSLCVEVRRRRRRLALPDGTSVERGEPVGILHLGTRRAPGIRRASSSPLAGGLEFRRRLLHSLRALAAEARDDGRWGRLRAFSATTIHADGMRRLGFEPALHDRLVFPRLAGRYVDALTRALHAPDAQGGPRGRRRTAERLWISRARLLGFYGGDGMEERARRPGAREGATGADNAEPLPPPDG